MMSPEVIFDPIRPIVAPIDSCCREFFGNRVEGGSKDLKSTSFWASS